MSADIHAQGPGAPTDAAAQAAAAGDEAAFARVVSRHRRELHVHCYRMVASFEDAEDLVQETFLRAWRRRETFAGRATFRAWLYRIATNACLDHLERRGRTVPAGGGDGATFEVPWLQPYPDALLEEVADGEPQPHEAVVQRETIELAFIVALQHVPPRPRAVLALRDLLGWPAKDIAEALGSSVASVNSALQRARETLRRHLPERRSDWTGSADAGPALRALLARYVEASEQGDAAGLAALMSDDVRCTMPPDPGVWKGRDTVVRSWVEGGFGTAEFGDLQCVLTSANGQPAVACYLRREGEEQARAMAVDVLRIEDGAIVDIVVFPADVFPALDLPPVR